MEPIEIILEQDDFKNNVDFIKDGIKERGVEPTGDLVLFGIAFMYKHIIEDEFKDELKKGKKYSVSIQGEGAIGDAIYFVSSVGGGISSIEFDMPFLCNFGFNPNDVILATIAIRQAA